MDNINEYIEYIKIFRSIGKEISEQVIKIYEEGRANEVIGRGAGGDTTKKIDKVAEDIIVEKISENFKNFKIISEELGEKSYGNENIKDYFFIDPIDGSNNAIRGIRLFSTSIALSSSPYINDVKFAYIKNIFGEEYYAAKGYGAYINDNEKERKLLIKEQNKNSDDEIEFLGFEISPYAKNLEKISPVLKLGKHYRSVGSIALGLCYVATGALDAYIDFRNPRILDISAAKLIIEESNGIFFLERGNLKVSTTERSNFIAGNKKVVERIRKVLRI